MNSTAHSGPALKASSNHDWKTEKTIVREKRVYFWLPDPEVAFFQSLIEAEDNLARIRTEKNHERKALIVLMFDESRQTDLDDILRCYSLESQVDIVYVDSQGRSFV